MGWSDWEKNVLRNVCKLSGPDFWSARPRHREWDAERPGFSSQEILIFIEGIFLG